MARTTLDLDEKLIARGMEVTGARTKKALVERAVDELVKGELRKRLIERIEKGDLGLDMSLEELLKLRGCDEAREETRRLQSKLA
jgi:Arc/MetJ family transcription regulator